MLREDIEQYSKLTSKDGWHVPIVKIGAYLDGYNKGLAVLDKVRAEIEAYDDLIGHDAQVRWCLSIIDKYRAESEE